MNARPAIAKARAAKPAGYAFGTAVQPNELDLRRIVRSLARRSRYRYVTPRVEPCATGYRVTSPCCSRRVAPDGGTIDIAWIEFEAPRGLWRLHYRNHDEAQWCLYREWPGLGELLDCLNEDAEHAFWP